MTRLLPVTLVALVVSPACAVNIDHEGYIERDEKRFTVQGVADLHLYTFDGAVDVRSWDRPDIVIEIEKRGQDKDAVGRIQVLAEQKAQRIQVEARRPGTGNVFVGIGTFRSPSARFIANVPRRTNVVVRTGDGAILVQRVEGRLELRTDDGTIKAVETAGELVAESRDGTVQVDDVTGRVEARTDDGSLRVTGTPSSLRVRSGDGGIVLRLRRGTKMAEDWMVTTSDGSISVELPDGFSAELEADPGSDGRARTDIQLIDHTGGTREQRVLRGRLGEGGHRFVLRTGDGTIRITNY